MLRLRIRELLQNKGIDQPYKWLTGIGISHHSAYKLLNRNNNRIRQKHIMIICQHAWCTPNDLFEYVADEVTLDKNHPLHKLSNRDTYDILGRLQKMTPDEITELRKFIDKEKG